MNIKKLITDVKEKMTIEETIALLCNHICSDKDSMRCCYKDLYHRAYGNVMTKEVATEWVMSFKVTDGSERDNGQKWTLEQCVEVGNKIGVDWSKIGKIDWYIALNMEYSKHYNTAKAYETETDPIWFAHIAKDEWCGEEKVDMLEYYFEKVL